MAEVISGLSKECGGRKTRNKLTDYWSEHDIKEGKEYAILTNIIHQEWAEVSVNNHKKMKGLKTHNLRRSHE